MNDRERGTSVFTAINPVKNRMAERGLALMLGNNAAAEDCTALQSGLSPVYLRFRTWYSCYTHTVLIDRKGI